jgi:NTE family protein
LGSGGVRSIAARGMVEVLAREGLRPDLVVSCSAGAMFGALIAAGHGAEEAVCIATTLWSADVTRQRRWRALPQMLWPRLGRFDADFARRDDRLVMQRLAQAFGDVGIECPRLERRVGLFDTAAMPYQIDADRRATEAALPEIRALLHRAPQLAVA